MSGQRPDSGWRTIPLAYPGRCGNCGLLIARGTLASWKRGHGVKHLDLDSLLPEGKTAARRSARAPNARGAAQTVTARDIGELFRDRRACP